MQLSVKKITRADAPESSDLRSLKEETANQAASSVRIVITEKLNDILEGSHKKVYRARLLSSSAAVTRRDDALIGGDMEMPLRTLEGGMSVVVVIPDTADDRWERNIGAIERESKILCKLQHDNIIGVLLPFQEVVVKNRITKTIMQCMVTEAVRPLGFDLVAYMQMFQTSKKSMPLEDVHALVAQMHSGLVHMHEQGIVHRNLKPDNILVDRDFRVKIIDFEYASAPGLELEKMNMANLSLAPEVNDDAQPPSIDYWGLGLTVHSFFHCCSKVRQEVEAARFDVDKFWDSKRFPQWGQIKIPTDDSIMDLRRGLLSMGCGRWGREQITQWLGSSMPQPVKRPRTQIYPWLGPVKNSFLLTLPHDFPTTSLGELNLGARILGIDGPDGVKLHPGGDTTLKAGLGVYFAFEVGCPDEVILRETFQKLNAPHVLQEAHRVPTNDSICDKLIMFGREERRCGFITLRPVFDVFAFPGHCVGAALGSAGLDLCNKFGICVDGLVREDGTILWWPSESDIVHEGDQALVLRDFAEEHRQTPIITMTMEKVECLQHEQSFRKQVGLPDGQWYPWQASDVPVQFAQNDEKASFPWGTQQRRQRRLHARHSGRHRRC